MGIWSGRQQTKATITFPMSERFVILYINKSNKEMNENLQVVEESDGLGGYVYVIKETKTL